MSQVHVDSGCSGPKKQRTDRSDADEAPDNNSETDEETKPIIVHVDHWMRPAVFCDVSLRVEKNRIHTNKAVLSASPVFCKMLGGDFAEKNCNEIPLPDKPYDILLLMLKYLHHDVRRDAILALGRGDALNLYAVANEYQLDELEELCRKCLINLVGNGLKTQTMYRYDGDIYSKVAGEHCDSIEFFDETSQEFLFSVYSLGEIYGDGTLLETAEKFLISFFLDLGSKSYLSLSQTSKLRLLQAVAQDAGRGGTIRDAPESVVIS